MGVGFNKLHYVVVVGYSIGKKIAVLDPNNELYEYKISNFED